MRCSYLLSWMFVLLLSIALVGCSLAQPAPASTPVMLPSPTQPSQTLAPPTLAPPTQSPPTAAPATQAPPSPTVPPPPTSTNSPVAPPPPTPLSPPASQAPGVQKIYIYLIALEDNGLSGKPVGCGDSVLPVAVQIAPTKGVLRAALLELLSLKSQYYGESGIYNALYQSDLALENVTIENGVARIWLQGSLALGGVCDNPRLEAQLTETALQFSTVQAVEVFINGQPLEEILSQQ